MKHTSHLAYQDIVGSGRAGTLKAKVYGVVRRTPHITQIEISKLLGESARKRVSELVKERKIYETGTRTIGNLHYISYAVDPQLNLF